MRTHTQKPIARSATDERDTDPTPPAPTVVRPVAVPGLTVGHADAPAERAADSLADTALARLQRLGQRGAMGTAAQESGNLNVLSRLPRTTTAGQAVIGRVGGPLDQVTGDAITSCLGRGSSLPEPSRSRMEAAFGAHLGHVRVHDDATAGKLNDAVSAHAFTLGNDIFIGRDVTAATPGGERVLAHEIAHVLADPGDVHRLHRWWRPYSGLPDPNFPPLNQPKPVLWEEVLEDPRGGVYRFVDAEGQGWQAPGPKAKWIRNDWRTAAERAARLAATNWVDASNKGKAKWAKGAVPANYRAALEEERPSLRFFKNLEKYNYTDAAAVPVYVKAKYRRKPGSRDTTGDRGPGLRALDRAARLLMTDKTDPETGTPHLATATTGGIFHVAGNTGNRRVSDEDEVRGRTALTGALTPTTVLPQDKRARKDAIKLRALQSRDYRAHHSAADRGLAELSTALTKTPEWHNVEEATADGSAEHGEMTILGRLHAELKANLNLTGTTKVRDLGGVKLACGACQLA